MTHRSTTRRQLAGLISGRYPHHPLTENHYKFTIPCSSTITITASLILSSVLHNIHTPSSETMSANGTSSRKWANGPSVPLTTPFREDESIDYEALAKQVVRLAKAGEGIVLLGTNGEGKLWCPTSASPADITASHLSQPERKAAVEAARKALDSNGFQDAPLLVGTGGELHFMRSYGISADF